nr:VOC family protein [Burkholderia sp. BE17]
MSQRIQRITPFLWFDHDAEAAAGFYVSVFDNARIVHVARYGKAGAHASGQAEGAVMTVAFELDGQAFVALNGGPVFQMTPAVSFVVNCRDQDEIDRYWARLSEGGDERAQAVRLAARPFRRVVAGRARADVRADDGRSGTRRARDGAGNDDEEARSRCAAAGGGRLGPGPEAGRRAPPSYGRGSGGRARTRRFRRAPRRPERWRNTGR